MNRLDEYTNIKQELEQPVPELDQTLDRAHHKQRKRIVHSIANIAASFILFVLLVNFCAPVAYACSKIPILRELAEAVTFSRSLSDAVDNEYVQPLYLSQTDGGVTASVEYLIVDQKQVNVFFRLDSDTYPNLGVEPQVLSADGNHFASCSYGLNAWDVPNGELQSVTIDYVNNDVPDRLRLQLDIRNMDDFFEEDSTMTAPESISNPMFEDVITEESDFDFIAHFDFLLEFDPAYTAAGKIFPINQTVMLDGQEITFTDMEVYPTHLRVNVNDAPENTAWLKMLYFYVETDWGMKFDAISNGISATGSPDTPSMTSFRADSAYFYDAKHLKLVITGAEWLNKDMETIYVNLQTGETGPLPEGVELYAITREPEGWLLEFQAVERKPDHYHQLFSMVYYDMEGNGYDINSRSCTTGFTNEEGTTSFREMFPLKDYPYEEAMLCPHYSHVWTAEKPITVIVQ